MSGPDQTTDLNDTGELPAQEPLPAVAPANPSADALTDSSPVVRAGASEIASGASAETLAQASAVAPLAASELAELVEKAVEVSLAPALRRIEDALANASHKDSVIEKMHGELQLHRDNLVAQATLPLKMGLIRLYANLGTTLDFYRKNGYQALDAERAMSLLEGLQMQVEIVLGDGGVTAYRTEGELFEPRRQRAPRTAPAPEPAQVGAIAERLLPGFESDGRILEKESVMVFVTAPSSGPAPSAPAPSPTDPTPPQGSPP